MAQATFIKSHAAEGGSGCAYGLLNLWSDCAALAKSLAGFFDRLAAFEFERSLQRRGEQENLQSIVGYANFIAAHPDMPQSHRERFLKQISRCSSEALKQRR